MKTHGQVYPPLLFDDVGNRIPVRFAVGYMRDEASEITYQVWHVERAETPIQAAQALDTARGLDGVASAVMMCVYRDGTVLSNKLYTSESMILKTPQAISLWGYEELCYRAFETCWGDTIPLSPVPGVRPTLSRLTVDSDGKADEADRHDDVTAAGRLTDDGNPHPTEWPDGGSDCDGPDKTYQTALPLGHDGADETMAAEFINAYRSPSWCVGSSIQPARPPFTVVERNLAIEMVHQLAHYPGESRAEATEAASNLRRLRRMDAHTLNRLCRSAAAAGGFGV